MSGKPSEQEPSIEEILASIRQIISDDEEPAAAAAAPPPPPPAPKSAPPPPPKKEDDVFELTDKIDDEPEPEPEPAPKPRVEIDMRDAEEGQSILTDHAAGAALEGFMKMAGSSMPVDRKGTGTVTLEDIVRELMRPMLREWLDVHLPPIIEKVVQKELDKIARKAVD